MYACVFGEEGCIQMAVCVVCVRAYTHTHTRTHARTHAHTHTLSRTHARTHTHAHAHTHTRARREREREMNWDGQNEYIERPANTCSTRTMGFFFLPNGLDIVLTELNV